MVVPLHARFTPTEIISSTLKGADTSFARRAPEAEVPPELEAICARACADPS